MFQKIIKYTLLGLASAFLGHSSYTILKQKRKEKEERMQWGGKLRCEVVKIVINNYKIGYCEGMKDWILNDPGGRDWKNDLIEGSEEKGSDLTIEETVDNLVKNYLWSMGNTGGFDTDPSSGGFTYSWLYDELKKLNVQNPKEKIPEYFGGILTIDEYVNNRGW